jgi:hypothetical protein
MDQSWRMQASCAGIESVMFFGHSGTTAIQTARRICTQCAVRNECLRAALTYERGAHPTNRAGIWGGLTRTERAALDPSHGGPGRKPTMT